MAFELYFNISKTAVELAVIGLMTAGALYVINDLTKEKEEEKIPVINPYTAG